MGHVILTVDAAAGVRQMVSFTLKGAGYDVIEAESYRDAHEKLKETKIDMVLADLNIPNENAREFLKEMQKNPQLKLIPIIVLTTESHHTLKQKFLNTGATAWIDKPLKPDRLVSIVKKFLNNIK